MKKLFLPLFLLFFTVGCGARQIEEPKVLTQEDGIKIADMLSDFGVLGVDTKRVVDTVVVHTAYSIDGDPYDPQSLYAVFKKYNVSPHYMIARDGIIYRMVEENNIAYHAGKSKMKDGRDGVNAFSIGIELISSTTDTPTPKQYNSLAKLIINIKSRHRIEHIVGHSDIAPARKSDPWNFDFTTLNEIIEKQTIYTKKGDK